MSIQKKIFITFLLSTYAAITGLHAQVVWGDNNSRTEFRDDAGLQGNAGAVSGFFQTGSPVNYPLGATGWWHLLDIRHGNTTNNYAMQFAGSFFDQYLWFRKTNGSPATPWSRILAEIDGRVGIGNTNPAYKLDVVANNNMAIARVFSTDATRADLRLETMGNGMNYITFGNGAIFDRGRIEYAHVSNSMHFLTNSIERLRITENGNIGIGTSNPLEKIQIGDRFTFQDGGWKGIMYNMAWNAGMNSNARIVSGPATAMYFTSTGNIVFQNAPSAAQGAIVNDALHSLIVYNSGQVGVGTNSNLTSVQDLTTKLFVEGGVRARKVKVDQANWADFVFEKDYKLPTLTEVETYIRTHKHLQGVPTEQEVVNEGLDLGQTQAVLLQKIEELTLYIIELNKQLQQQQKKQEVLEELIQKMKIEKSN